VELIKELPVLLEETLARAFPDALWITSQKHSEECYTVWVLDLDYSYTQWVGHLSLDDRWTVSPVRGPWQNTQARYRDRNEGKQWRKKARKLQ
jgi:hypothetical protein